MSLLLRPRGAEPDAGFTLMEVMVALVVLTIGLISIAFLMADVYKGSIRSRYMSLAATFASEKLEDLMQLLPFGPPSPLGGRQCRLDDEFGGGDRADQSRARE